MHTASNPPRGARLAGVALVVFSAVAFSAKAIIIKLAYRHGTDAVTLLALRMAMAAPFFLAIAWWTGRGGVTAALAGADWRAIAFMGILGYYLASLFDFLGLQYITAALERLVLFLYPTFVVLISAALYGRAITGRDLAALALSYFGIALVFPNDLATRHENVLLGAFWVALACRGTRCPPRARPPGPRCRRRRRRARRRTSSRCPRARSRASSWRARETPCGSASATARSSR